MRHETFPSVSVRRLLNLRQAERLPFDVIADVKIGHGKWQRARISDISARGFRIVWFPSASAGQSVLIRIPGLEPLAATTRWVSVGGIGCEFQRPLSIYILEHLAKRRA